MRLWLLGEVKVVESSLRGLLRVLVERADQEKDILMPGYTHLQVRIFLLRCTFCEDFVSVANPFVGLISCFPTRLR